MRKTGIDKDKLNAIAVPLSPATRTRMDERRGNRHWWSASTAIAAKIRRQLKKLNMSQTEFADLLGITPANVTRYLNGRTNFELKTLIEIERAIGIHIIDRSVVPEDELLPPDYPTTGENEKEMARMSVNITFNIDNYPRVDNYSQKWESAIDLCSEPETFILNNYV